MATHTPENIRTVIDYLDSTFRKAIEEKRFKEVFAKERNLLVSGVLYLSNN